MKKIAIIVTVVLLAIATGVFFINTSSNSSTTSSTPGTTQSSNTSPDTGSSTSFTAAQVAEHNSSNDCWTIINGEVYDITTYVKQHPGGRVITEACGVDGTTAFDTQGGEGTHSPTAKALLSSFKIGSLAQ